MLPWFQRVAFVPFDLQNFILASVLLHDIEKLTFIQNCTHLQYFVLDQETSKSRYTSILQVLTILGALVPMKNTCLGMEKRHLGCQISSKSRIPAWLSDRQKRIHVKVKHYFQVKNLIILKNKICYLFFIKATPSLQIM